MLEFIIRQAEYIIVLVPAFAAMMVLTKEYDARAPLLSVAIFLLGIIAGRIYQARKESKNA